MNERPLRVRSLGSVRYADAQALQRALMTSHEDYLLLLEHPHVFTQGVRAKPEHLLVDPASVGAELVEADRGGDITYHGPGQLVGYPIVSLPIRHRVVPDYVASIEQVVIDALRELGLENSGRLDGFPGVWVDPDGRQPRKVCAVGVRVSRGRTMHGFALNVDPDLALFDAIVPCGISGCVVTSLAAEGLDVSMSEVRATVVRHAASIGMAGERPVELVEETSPSTRSRASVEPAAVVLEAVGAPSSHRRIAAAGVDATTAVTISSRKPEWLRVEAEMGKPYLALRRTMRSLDLVTVCEEAGCPNIYECWSDGTATFMINGDRCTRSCGFCLVDTRRPLPLDPDEPRRVAAAVRSMGLRFAVVTTVARDDLDDGGAGAFAATIAAVRRENPATRIEALISDCKGDARSLSTIFAAAPDVLNHNLETVLRLQRAVRPSASYARSLAVLGRAKAAGLTTKSGIMVGLGEERAEVEAALVDLASVGVDIVTIGQYVRPSAHHLPVARYVAPEEFTELDAFARSLGFSHVEASPLARSSYHARQAASTSVTMDATA